MKIYTRTGDKGITSLIGGHRVPKTHKRIEAYGSIDELICNIGLIRDYCKDKKIRQALLTVQTNLMTCAAWVACDKQGIKLPTINDEIIAAMEKDIDRMIMSLPPQKYFLLPGGHPVISHCHIARTICRRAERSCLNAIAITKTNKNIFIYINRLSDYLYILARQLSKIQKVEEIFWIST